MEPDKSFSVETTENSISISERSVKEDNPEKAKLEKSIGLLSSITIIVGSVIGSGIFISPIGIIKHMHSFGASIVIWVVCGLYSLMGAYCYAELGTMLPSSGADYSYVLEAFGPFMGFLRMWIEVLAVRPASAAVIAIVFAKYTVHPFFSTCDGPASVYTLVSIICVLTLGMINCISVKLSTRTQIVFTFAKVLALVMIIITGFVRIGQGHTEGFQDAFEGSNWKPSSITLAFYTGLFSYAGWNYLNCMIEEMENPRKHLPIAIAISCTLITAVYTMANVAYVSVLSVNDILNSPAVAVDFANQVYGKAWFIMSIFVAMSTFGGANGTILTTSRIFFVAGREKQMPQLFSMLQMKLITPIPAIIFTCTVTIVYILTGNIESLLTYLGFVQWLAVGFSILILIIFRFTRPELERPVKVFIAIPIIYLLITVFLLIYTFVGAPLEAAYGLLFIASGIPFYCFGCMWKNKPKKFNLLIDRITRGAQKLFLLEPES